MSNSSTGFDPKGFFKSTRELEYESYCQGIEDVMDLLTAEQEISYGLRDKVLSIVCEAADDFS